MDKLIPDPPLNTTDPDAEETQSEALLRDREAIKRALDYYLDPPSQYTEKPRRPSTMYMIAPNMDTESLLAQASASVMTSDFAANLIGPQRNTVLAIQQIIMLAELAVNRALDNVDPA
ncbi:DUF6124 family protein [Pseudomonas sp. URMO17WK12:I11]|uniref:DUF6124 family protein n=1 Tax=Pseudomonas sp. URMO17WK12:I11 TaxID=1283291 RepID=UPI00071F40CC|nr:DUF6124 family protein [Pseudomonas sp. URMO17WK12:I11]CRL50883.1 hypothetical protein PSHI_40480 [Pseudomonas sp. URMO17WK12:I11]